MEAILELLKLALVGLVSGVFSYFISNWRHRSEKWWDLRVAAYQDVIGALSDLNHYFDTHLDAEMMQRELSTERTKELQAFWDNSYHKIRKAADAGAFLFSTKAEAALKKFMKGEGADCDSYFDYLDCRLASTKKCLEDLITCSKHDLRLQ